MVWWRNYDDISSRFHRIPECNGRTDGQADRIAISILHVSLLKWDKKWCKNILTQRYKNCDKLLTDNYSHHKVNSLRNILIYGHNTDVMHTCNWLLCSYWNWLHCDGTWYAEVSWEINNNDNDKLNVNWTYRILIGAVWRTAPIIMLSRNVLKHQRARCILLSFSF